MATADRVVPNCRTRQRATPTLTVAAYDILWGLSAVEIFVAAQQDVIHLAVALWNITAELVAAGDHAFQVWELALWEGAAELVAVDVEVLKMGEIANAGMQFCEARPAHLQELQRLRVHTYISRKLGNHVVVQIKRLQLRKTTRLTTAMSNHFYLLKVASRFQPGINLVCSN